MITKDVGTCPLCDYETLDYGISTPEGESLRYEVCCSKCGFSGYEWYELTFSEYTDREGNRIV
jgi:hypothetical protein